MGFVTRKLATSCQHEANSIIKGGSLRAYEKPTIKYFSRKFVELVKRQDQQFETSCVKLRHMYYLPETGGIL